LKRLSYLFLITLIFVSTCSLGQIISTIAGGGVNPNVEPIGLKNFPISIGTSMSIYNDKIFIAGGNIVYRLDEVNQKADVVAGTGESGYSGDGSQATEAKIGFSPSIAVDNNGNLYITSSLTSVIRKVDAISGIITTIAGSTSSGFSGDGGLAALAKLNSPGSIVIDQSGNILFHDRGNYRIRKIDAVTKIISTITGTGTSGFSGDGTFATLAMIEGGPVLPELICNLTGDIFFTDNNRVRKIDAITNLLSTVAGNGSIGYAGDGGSAINASLNTPWGLAFDTNGNLLFSDSKNNRIRKVDKITGQISTIAGTGLQAYKFSNNGDGAAAIFSKISPHNLLVSSNGSIYVSEIGNTRIRKIDPSGTIKILIGSGSKFYGDGVSSLSAVLSHPSGICLSNGNIYMADQTNNQIRKVDLKTGIITTVAGDGDEGFKGDGVLATNTSLFVPFTVQVDKAGDIFIADWRFSKIRKVDRNTGIISTVAGKGSFGSSFSGDGGPAVDAFLNLPTSVAFDLSGNLIIADRSNHRIRKVDKTTNIITTIAGTGAPGFSGDGSLALNAQFNLPANLIYDVQGNLYVSDQTNHRIRKIDAVTGIVTTIAGNGTTSYTQDGLKALDVGINLPYGMAFDKVNNLLIADAGNNRILRIESGLVYTLAGTGVEGFSGDSDFGTNAKLSFPRDVVVDDDGIIYIADAENARIRKLEGVEQVTGLFDESNNQVSLYPNPATDKVYLDFDGLESNNAQVEIFDLRGRIVNVDATHKNSQILLSLSHLHQGMYIVRLKVNGATWESKFIKL